MGNVTIAASGASPSPEMAFFMTPDEIRARQRDRRNALRFDPGGRPAARGCAGPSGGVADDDGVDAARLTCAAVSSLPIRALPCGKASIGSTSMPGEIPLEQRLEEREHAVGLPLLVADEADALARERCESRRVRLPRLEAAATGHGIRA